MSISIFKTSVLMIGRDYVYTKFLGAENGHGHHGMPSEVVPKYMRMMLPMDLDDVPTAFRVIWEHHKYLRLHEL